MHQQEDHILTLRQRWNCLQGSWELVPAWSSQSHSLGGPKVLVPGHSRELDVEWGSWDMVL